MSGKILKNSGSGNCWEVVSGFDEIYLWPWLISVFSGTQSSKMLQNRTIATTNNGISNEGRDLISEFAEWLGFNLTYMEISLPEGLPTNDHFTPIVYARLLVAEQLHDNFIWMDVDTLLLQRWDELLALPKLTKGFISRAVLEPVSVIHEDWNNEAIRKAGNCYFNAGIMQIDPNAFRENGFHQQWRYLVNEYTERGFKYADQCVLNYMLAGLNVPLPKEFNYLPNFWNDKLLNSPPPSVIHFAGGRKPWQIPKIERNHFFNVLRVHHADTEYFKLYWETEQELLVHAKQYSSHFASKLEKVRNSRIKPIEISRKRLLNRIRQVK